ncbi:MAG: hypothetical protein ACYC0W_02045, partial [Candidatus Nanopelagicales bacterium]
GAAFFFAAGAAFFFAAGAAFFFAAGAAFFAAGAAFFAAGAAFFAMILDTAPRATDVTEAAISASCPPRAWMHPVGASRGHGRPMSVGW